MVSRQCGFFHASSNVLFDWSLLSHFEQLKGFSSVWIFSWLFKWWDRLNFFPRMQQLNGLSSVWSLSCFIRSLESLFSHFEQLKGSGFFPASSKHLVHCICIHSFNSWRASQHYGFFHEDSNCLLRWILCQTLSSWAVSSKCCISTKQIEKGRES